MIIKKIRIKEYQFIILKSTKQCKVRHQDTIKIQLWILQRISSNTQMKKFNTNLKTHTRDIKAKFLKGIFKNKLPKKFKKEKWHFIGEMRVHYLLSSKLITMISTFSISMSSVQITSK